MIRTVTYATLLSVIAACLAGCEKKDSGSPSDHAIPEIKVGHVGHDHHLAMFVAADNAAHYEKTTGIGLTPIQDRLQYELTDGDNKISDIRVIKVGGGSKMPTALAQDVIDVGFGGVAAVLAAVDKGAPIRLISPLHNKGDMFVVSPDFPAATWAEFVELAKKTKKPIRIAYKNPMAVAKVIFEQALTHEGITFSGDASAPNLRIHLINAKGGGKLNNAISGGLVEGYVGNNPFPSIAVEKGLARIVCDLEDLPPGTFRNHPCCCIAATTDAIKNHPDEITALLLLFLQANETINTDLDAAVASATKWIGTTQTVEKMSIPTGGYSMEPSDQWHETMEKWAQAMRGLGALTGELKDLTTDQLAEHAYDFSLLNKAKNRLAESTKQN